ncbi:MAG: TolC family protein [Chitinophagales bacterium]|nr:TolC family protein [Chitinophagales bacterium]
MKLVNIHTLRFMVWFALGFGAQNATQAQTMTLQQCVETALLNNKNLQVGRNNLSLSQLKRQEAKAMLLPKATASADYKFFTNLPYQLLPLSVFNGPEGLYKEAQFGVPHNLGINVQLAMPLYNPQIRGGINATEIASELSNLQVEKSEEQVIFEVTNLYYNAQILQYQLLFVDSNLVNTSRLLANIKLLRAQGLAKGTDVGKIELQQAQLQTQRSQLDSKSAQVLNGLKFFMGKNLDAPLAVQTAIAQGEKNEYTVLPSLDARIVQTQNRLLASELNTIKKSRLPSVSVVANYGLSGFGYFKQPEPFFKIFPIGFIGAQATYPLWNKVTRHQIAQKEAELESNRLQSANVQAQNNLMLANAILQKNATVANLPAAAQQIELAKSVYQQTLLQQQQGTATLTDILLADNALREAQQNYLNLLVDYLKADLELKKASGSIKN